MTNYLLEKSRVIYQMQGERNYHIFYHLLKGAPPNIIKDLGLKGMKTYEYLKKSECFDVSTIDDEKCFLEVQTSFNVKI